MELVKIYEIVRFEGNSKRSVQDIVIVEHYIALYVNGEHYADFLCTPADLKELIYGHLYGQGLIHRASQIQHLSVMGNRIEARITPEMTLEKPTKFGEVRINRGELGEIMSWFNDQSTLFATTGGAHSCALCQPGGPRIFKEDLGRHNAVDKALGTALLMGWDLTMSYLITSGRISGELVSKALHTGVQIIISPSAPMDQGVELARKHGITLCGFARGERVNVYSAPERIE